jgi:hypothetical protein
LDLGSGDNFGKILIILAETGNLAHLSYLVVENETQIDGK